MLGKYSFEYLFYKFSNFISDIQNLTIIHTYTNTNPQKKTDII